jgi:ribosome-binding protein aMBF1 (putative translation factor)
MKKIRKSQRHPSIARRQERRAISFVGNIRHSIQARFGNALRKKRIEAGMTQAELAAATGLNRSYLSEVECGHEGISLERADRLAHALGCELAQLLSE